MTKRMLTILFVLFSTYGYSQCTFEKLFPVEHGITKFEAINKIATIKNIVSYEYEGHSNINNYWFKYNENDSAYRSTLLYEYTLLNGCFLGQKNTIDISFVNDQLYEFLVMIRFPKNQYNECLENYNLLIEVLKTRFEYYEPYYLTNRNNEKTGEGTYLSDSEVTFDNAMEKNNLVSITYEIQFDWVTETPSGYLIKLRYKNNLGTIFEK